jgi:glycosyltransferase involved in cell wall biosynthesis
MEVIHVIARVNQGGTATWLNSLINGMRATGEKVHLLAGHVQAGEIEDPVFSQLKGQRIPRMGRSVSIFNDLIALFELRRMIKQIEPDLVNTHTAKAGVIGRIAVISLGRKRPKLVHTYHGHILYGYFGKLKVRLIIGIERTLAKRTDLLIAAGEKVKNELLEANIGCREQYIVINPGIARPNFIERSAARRAFKLNDEKLVVGWMGRLVSVKQPHRVLKIADEFPEIDFLLAGTGPLEEYLRESQTRNVSFVGWVMPKDFWPAVDIALLTSENEAQPIVLIEAGMLGIPAIAENVGSVSEVVVDEKTGLLTNGETNRIIQLERLVSDEKLRKIMGLASQLYVAEHFGLGRFISKHLEAYRSL